MFYQVQKLNKGPSHSGLTFHIELSELGQLRSNISFGTFKLCTMWEDALGFYYLNFSPKFPPIVQAVNHIAAHAKSGRGNKLKRVAKQRKGSLLQKYPQTFDQTI